MLKKFFLVMLLSLIANYSSAISIIRDSEIETMVGKIARPIFITAGIVPENIKIYIYQSPEINAFVTHNKMMFISTGLIAFSERPDTLAGVIAHETGHMVEGHLFAIAQESKNIERDMMLYTIASAVIGVATGSVGAAAGSLMAAQEYSFGKMMSFSRSQEEAADHHAMDYMHELGSANKGLGELLQSFVQHERLNNDKSFAYLRSHPLSQERIESLKSFTSKKQPSKSDFLTAQIREKFKYTSLKCLAISESPHKVIAKLSKNPNDKPSIYGLSIAAYQKGDMQLALKNINSLVNLEPNNPYFLNVAASVNLYLKNIATALQLFEKSYKIEPKSLVLKYEYANALIIANQKIDESIKLLESILIEEHENAMVYQTLGKAYALKGDKTNSYLALGTASAYNMDLEAAKRFLNYAKNTNIEVEGFSKSAIRYRDLMQLISDL